MTAGMAGAWLQAWRSGWVELWQAWPSGSRMCFGFPLAAAAPAAALVM